MKTRGLWLLFIDNIYINLALSISDDVHNVGKWYNADRLVGIIHYPQSMNSVETKFQYNMFQCSFRAAHQWLLYLTILQHMVALVTSP